MNKTPNIGLPLYEAGEIPAHMGDWNSTMQAIDDNIGSGGGGGSISTPIVKNLGYLTEPNFNNTFRFSSEGIDWDSTTQFVCCFVQMDATNDRMVETITLCASLRQLNDHEVLHYMDDSTNNYIELVWGIDGYTSDNILYVDKKPSYTRNILSATAYLIDVGGTAKER